MAHMNGFEKHGLDEEPFGDQSGLSSLKTFDAFRKYISKHMSRFSDIPALPVRLLVQAVIVARLLIGSKIQRRLSRRIHLPPIVAGNGRSSFSSFVLFLPYPSYELGGQAPNLIISASNEV